MKSKNEFRKIALFIPNLEGGGAEKIMVFLANSFVNKGFQVDLIVGKLTGPYIQLLDEDIQIIDLNVKRIFYAIPKLRNYINSNSNVVLMSFLGYANIIALIANLIASKRVKHIISEREDISKTLNHGSFKKKVVIKKLMRLFYKRADRIIAISKKVGQSLEDEIGVNKSKIDIIYNPYINNNISELDECDFKNDTPVIVAVGRLVPIKNFEFLIEVFKIVNDKIEAKLLILGEGSERGEIEKKIEKLNLSKRVELLGFVSNPILHMNKADLFVKSSLSEGFGNVILEAMSCSLPIISTKCGGPEEILEQGKWGSLIDIGDLEGFSQEVIKCLEKRQKINYEDRLNDFSLEVISSKYLKVLFER